MENSDRVNPGQENPAKGIEFHKIIKQGCKHCLGRGYERYLSARILNPDQSITEQFEAVDCRCVKYRPIYSVSNTIAFQESDQQSQPETAGA